jgi:hypothetical protein
METSGVKMVLDVMIAERGWYELLDEYEAAEGCQVPVWAQCWSLSVLPGGVYS